MQHMNHPIDERLMENTQYRRLVAKHEQLDAEIMELQKGLAVDWDSIRQRKSSKLRVAEEMEAIRRMRL